MKSHGFTLVEVLAALMVFSVSIIGLTHAGTESARGVTVLEHKMLAGVIADNQLVLARIEDLKIGRQSGESKAMGRDFAWDLQTTRTDTPGFYRLQVKVKRPNDPQVLIDRTAFRKEGPS